MTELDELIYGKDATTKVVSVEPKDGQLVIFRELEDGTITESSIRRRPFVLTNIMPNKTWKKLEGNQYYKYGKQFDTLEDWDEAVKRCRKYDSYTVRNLKENLLITSGLTYFKDMKPSDVSILAFDIETTGLKHNDDSKVVLIANTFRKKGVLTRKMFCYDEYPSQKDMIKAWCDWVREMNPSILCNHNIFGFDLPYLSFVAGRENYQLELGRDGSAITYNSYESKFRKDQTQDIHYKKCFVYGREIVDTFFLAVKLDQVTKKYESYGLKSIIKTEGLEKSDRQFYDASQIRFKYQDPSEWEKIKQYAEHDGDDALALFDIFIPQTFYLAQSVPKSLQEITISASGSQINSVMVRSYLQKGFSIPKPSENYKFEGALVGSAFGFYSNVVKWDVASLYPNIMMQYEVYDKDKDPSANMLKILKYFTEFRLRNKKLAKETGDKYYDDLQSTAKAFINSMYGFMGATGLNFNSCKNAELVTAHGREILGKAMDWATRLNFKIVNWDTDSLSVCKQDNSEFSPEEKESYRKKLNELFPKNISFEDDGYFLKFIVIADKTYVLWDGKKIKTKGSALKSSTKEIALKDFMNEIIKSMIEERYNYKEIYNKYIIEAMNVTDIKRWASKKTITDKVLHNTRTNEAKVRDAIKDTDYVEGDKIYTFYKEDGTLCLIERFTGHYNKFALVEKLFKATETFEMIIPAGTFLNYALKRNQAALQELLKSEKYVDISKDMRYTNVI